METFSEAHGCAGWTAEWGVRGSRWFRRQWQALQQALALSKPVVGWQRLFSVVCFSRCAGLSLLLACARRCPAAAGRAAAAACRGPVLGLLACLVVSHLRSRQGGHGGGRIRLSVHNVARRGCAGEQARWREHLLRSGSPSHHEGGPHVDPVHVEPHPGKAQELESLQGRAGGTLGARAPQLQACTLAATRAPQLQAACLGRGPAPLESPTQPQHSLAHPNLPVPGAPAAAPRLGPAPFSTFGSA